MQNATQLRDDIALVLMALLVGVAIGLLIGTLL
jgi:hypothetical protein